MPAEPTCAEFDQALLPTADAMEHLVGSVTPSGGGQIAMMAYVARARALLIAMISLCRANEHDAIGVLYRVLYEVWLHGFYVILEGDEGMKRLEGALNWEWSRMHRQFGGVAPPNDGERLSVHDLAEKVQSSMLSRTPLTNPTFAPLAYKNHYRVTSFHDVHGHLACLEPYRKDGRVLLRRDVRAPHHLLGVGAGLALSLGEAVAHAMSSTESEFAKARDGAMSLLRAHADGGRVDSGVESRADGAGRSRATP